MPASETFVIAGGGLAGAKAAEALREQGFSGRIVLAAEEDIRPYERPPLSKDYLQGKSERETIFVHSADWYDASRVELLPGTAVTGIDRGRREVTLSDGGRLAYGKLLLATGSAPRRLPLPGADADGVLYLRRVGDSDRIRDTFRAASRVLIIGAGWIGLEVAAAARLAGVEVTVLEAADLPLLHVLGPQVAPVFAGLHREHGADLRLGVRVAEITVSGQKATGARLADGTRIGADAVIIGIGAAPQTRLAEAAGLDVRDGVVTDASLRTSDPDIYAAGDIASAFHPLLGTHIRVEHWANALHQPETAAAAMLGRDAAYDRVPYFYTDQGMEYAGYAGPGGYDRVVFRGDVGKREFIAFWMSGGRVVAGMNVNIWDVTDAIQALIRSGQVADPARLADPAVPLEEVWSGPATAGITWLGSASHSCRHCRIRRHPAVVSGPPSGAIVPPDRRTIRARSGSRISRLGMSGLASRSVMSSCGHISPVIRRRTS
ncbi:MAG: NAD(P)/FAD-dependent oxidoreductase [Streptosporangiaceae bacterium]